MEDRGLSRDTLDSFLVGFVGKAYPGQDLYKGMISIPFLTVTGVVAIQYRAIGKREPRFLNYGSTKRMFNPAVLLEPHRTIFLCEGPIDTMTVSELDQPVVGIPGVDSWAPVFARAFRNRRVVVLADGDDKGQGQNFARRVSTDVDECATVLFEGEDVNSYMMKHGYEALGEKIGV